MTVEYALFMIDRYGSRTRSMLIEYGRCPEEITATFEKAAKEGYLEDTDGPKRPYLTDAGRQHLRDYYGNDFNGNDD
jgi:hypothetical protein